MPTTAFFNADATEEGKRSGYLVEFGPTAQIFNAPNQEATEHFVSIPSGAPLV